MEQHHPAADTLSRFVEGSLAAAEAVRVGWHLHACARCRETVGDSEPGRLALDRLFLGEPSADADQAYDSVISRTYRTLVEREADLQRDRARAPQLLAELMRHPPARQRFLLDNVGRFRSWGLVELVLARAARASFEHPATAEELAGLALAVAERLDTAVHSPPLLEDLEARCWIHFGNARRLRSDHPGAEEAFVRAEAHLANGTEDPLERANFLRMRASLRRDQQRMAEAEALFERAIAIYRRVGDRHQVGTTMVAVANLHWAQCEPERAIAVLSRATEMLEADREPHLAVVTRTNLLFYLADAGRFMEARALLAKSRELYARHPEASIRLRHIWAQGKVALGLGQFEHAEAALLQAREGFLARGSLYEVALISLELATLCIRLGRTAEVKRLAAEMLPVFQGLETRREALAAFLIFREAAERERANLQLLTEVQLRLIEEPGRALRRGEGTG